MNFQCQSIKNKVENVLIKEKGSKFIGFAYPIENEEDAQQKINHLNEQFSDATHVCYAYRLGYEGEIYRINDDGEPSGTAGMPIYNQIRSAELTYVLVAVIRYFGGTKLGVGGLIQTYRAAAEATLNEAKIVQYIKKTTYNIQFEYAQQVEVTKALERLEAKILHQNFTQKVEFTFEIPSINEEQIKPSFESIQHLIQLKKI